MYTIWMEESQWPAVLWHMEWRRLLLEDIDDAMMILIFADTCHRPGLKRNAVFNLDMYLNSAYKCTTVGQKDTLVTLLVASGVVKKASLWIMDPALCWSLTKITFVLNGWTDMWTIKSLKKCPGRNQSPTRCWIFGMHPRYFHITVFPTQYSCKLHTLFTVTGWKNLNFCLCPTQICSVGIHFIHTRAVSTKWYQLWYFHNETSML